MSNSKKDRTTFPMILHGEKVAAIYSTRSGLACHALTANTDKDSATAKALDHGKVSSIPLRRCCPC